MNHISRLPATGNDLIDITADIRTHMEIVIQLAAELAKSRPHGDVSSTARDLGGSVTDLLSDFVTGGLEHLAEREAASAWPAHTAAAHDRQDAARKAA